MSKSQRVWIFLGFILLTLTPGTHGSPTSAALRTALNAPVPGYDNGGQPLIPTLIGIARTMRIPMGIEKVTPAALRKPVSITLRGGTVATLLDACVRQLPDYHWAIHEGVVDIYGEKEWGRKSNLFNYVISRLDVKGGDLNLANAFLRMAVPETVAPVRANEPAQPGGVAGDTPGVGGLGSARVDLSFRNATVRSILNRIVALSHGKVIWMARVPPERLSHAPDGGLWLLMPPSSDIIYSLDSSLLKKPKKVVPAQPQR